MYERPGYQTLLGRIRGNVRTLIRKQLELPKQELGEILRANLQALKWLAIGAVFGLLTLIALTVFLIALVALILPWWLSALLVLVLFGVLAAYTGFRGYKKVELHGPTRSIKSLKETVQWAKARLLGQRES
ncbi:MAG TPA: phage holin family protein [Candidatus Saccharimonadales bacterium]|nr:phage holin family protein [Candidatus Saccharimonadales bacterium]